MKPLVNWVVLQKPARKFTEIGPAPKIGVQQSELKKIS